MWARAAGPHGHDRSRSRSIARAVRSSRTDGESQCADRRADRDHGREATDTRPVRAHVRRSQRVREEGGEHQPDQRELGDPAVTAEHARRAGPSPAGAPAHLNRVKNLTELKGRDEHPRDDEGGRHQCAHGRAQRSLGHHRTVVRHLYTSEGKYLIELPGSQLSWQAHCPAERI
jgi:hypothetical protein